MKDLRGSADDYPVLVSMVMHLEGQALLRLHDDAFDLETLAFSQNRVGSPWARHRPVNLYSLVLAQLELIDDSAHVLDSIAIGDQKRVDGINDYKILDANCRDYAVVALDVGIGDLMQDGFTYKVTLRWCLTNLCRRG